MLEVGLVDGVGKMDGIVDHDHPTGRRQLAEQYARGLGPGTVEGVDGGIVAEHEDVELGDVDPPALVPVPLDVAQEAGQ